MQGRRDKNTIATSLGVSSADNSTPIPLRVDPVTDYLLVNMTGSSNSATSATRCKRDQNTIPTKYGVSSVDGKTLVPIRTDSNGRLLITII